MDSFISPDNTWALWAILITIAALAIYLEQRYKWASKVTGCVLALIGAMLLSNLKIIPLEAPVYDAVWSYVVPLAIPFLLWNANIKKIWKGSGRMLGIFMLSSAGTIAGAFLGFFILRDLLPRADGVLAMLTGTYTGGSVNLVAMADAFKVGGEIVSPLIVADNLLMALYFFVLVAIPSVGFFLKRFRHPLVEQVNAQIAEGGERNQAKNFWAPKPISLKDIAIACAVCFLIVWVSTAAASWLASIIPTGNFLLDLANGIFGSKYIIITTLTMLLATYGHRFMSKINGAQELGTFFIHIFFTVIGVPASIYMVVTKAPVFLLLALIIVLVNMIISLLLGKLLKFDLEEIIIASNANIGGPTTAAAFAIAKGWEILIIPALLVGVFGYVVGNYYGIFVGTTIASLL